MIEQELFVIVYAFEKFYAYSISRKVVVHTEHAARHNLLAKQ